MHQMTVFATHEEKEILKDMSMWSVVISDSHVSHEYRFKASAHLSIALMFGLFMTVLKLAGYKK